MSNVIVVNEQDKVIGYKPRNDRNKTDITRITGLVVMNASNETLISRRALNKIHDPGKWTEAVSGTVEEGETYLSNIIKEAHEEIGLIVSEADLVTESHSYEDTDHKYFVMLFSTVADFPISHFHIQADEVEEILWISIPELNQWFQRAPGDFDLNFGKIVDFLNHKYGVI